MRLIADGDPAGELARFEAGLADGLDPQPAAASGADRAAVTGISSWWTGLACQTCGHTFRRGDRVQLAAGGATPVHLDPALRCGTAGDVSDQPPVDQGTVNQDPAPVEFAAGLVEAWPPADGVEATRLAPDDWHVARAGRRGRPIVCLYCAHTFRAGEYVVLCPCKYSGGADPAEEGCGAAVHRDPTAGLPCWENWCPSGTVSVCPVRLNLLGDAAP
ncbi:MAG TPA: hypothetical protein VGM10_03805 [Actinocrinis sp.]|jgi:hypothetical protein